jgi:hypothetical protein
MHKDSIATQELETSILKTLEVSKSLKKQVSYFQIFNLKKQLQSNCYIDICSLFIFEYKRKMKKYNTTTPELGEGYLFSTGFGSIDPSSGLFIFVKI